MRILLVMSTSTARRRIRRLLTQATAMANKSVQGKHQKMSEASIQFYSNSSTSSQWPAKQKQEQNQVSKEMLMHCDERRMLDSASTTHSFRDKWSRLSEFQIWGSLSRPTTGCNAKEELTNRFYKKYQSEAIWRGNSWQTCPGGLILLLQISSCGPHEMRHLLEIPHHPKSASTLRLIW